MQAFLKDNELIINSQILDNEKESKRKAILDTVEKGFAEITDYYDLINKNKEIFETMMNKIDKIQIETVITNNDRRISKGD